MSPLFQRILYLFLFFKYYIQSSLICRSSDSNVSEDAGIEPRTVANFDLKSDDLNQSVRSYPLTRLNLIHTWLDLMQLLGQILSTHSTRSHPLTWLDLIHTWLNLIQSFGYISSTTTVKIIQRKIIQKQSTNSFYVNLSEHDIYTYAGGINYYFLFRGATQSAEDSVAHKDVQ